MFMLEKRGWNRICIEIFASLVKKLCDIRNCKVINQLVSDRLGKVVGFHFKGTRLGIMQPKQDNQKKQIHTYYNTTTLEIIL
jgi:hypothetical protein